MKKTIEQLAEKLNGKLWVKGDLKRIYLNEGYNTKKMSTKTFIYEKDGEFKVSCYVECPSQPYQWIQNEQQRVIHYVLSKIDDVLNPFEEQETPILTVVNSVSEENQYLVGEKYIHSRFGIGEVISFEDGKVTMVFDCGVRPLLVKHVVLEKVA